MINKSVAWGFLDGAFQGPNHVYGAGFIRHLSYFHILKGNINLGQGTNNLGEFKALYALLKVAMDRYVLDL